MRPASLYFTRGTNPRPFCPGEFPRALASRPTPSSRNTAAARSGSTAACPGSAAARPSSAAGLHPGELHVESHPPHHPDAPTSHRIRPGTPSPPRRRAASRRLCHLVNSVSLGHASAIPMPSARVSDFLTLPSQVILLDPVSPSLSACLVPRSGESFLPPPCSDMLLCNHSTIHSATTTIPAKSMSCRSSMSPLDS